VGAEKDAITSLRAPTHFGRPNWDRVFPSIAEKHPDSDVGVVSTLSWATFNPSLTSTSQTVLLRSSGAVQANSYDVEQVLGPSRDKVLLRKGSVYPPTCVSKAIFSDVIPAENF